MMDQHKLRSLVFEKTGVKVDVDDPIFALVALNEAVLEEAVERHVARIDAASAALVRQVGGEPLADRPEADGARVATGGEDGGAHVAAGRDAAAVAAAAVAAPAAAGRMPALPAERRLLAIALGAAAFGAVLVLIGQAIFFRPAPVPPVQVPAPLTSEQIAAIAAGEKFQKVLPRLDTKTRNAVQVEMAKP